MHFEDEHNPELKQVYRSVVFTSLKTVKRLACSGTSRKLRTKDWHNMFSKFRLDLEDVFS